MINEFVDQRRINGKHAPTEGYGLMDTSDSTHNGRQSMSPSRVFQTLCRLGSDRSPSSKEFSLYERRWRAAAGERLRPKRFRNWYKGSFGSAKIPTDKFMDGFVDGFF